MIGMRCWLLEYRSDGAVNSYTTGTTMKDTFRADVDIHNMFCCRPETHYQPDKLQTCIVCHSAAGKPHAVCPQVLYQRPEKPLVDPPYRGPRPAVKECSLYNVRPTAFVLSVMMMMMMMMMMLRVTTNPEKSGNLKVIVKKSGKCVLACGVLPRLVRRQKIKIQ